jgi:hypothetical protein
MIGQMLAEIDGTNVLTIGTGAIGAVGAAWALVLNAYRRGVAKGKVEREVTVAGQPVGVRLHDAYVTRTEFIEFKAEIKSDVKDIRNSVDRMSEVILVRDETMRRTVKETAEALSLKIEAVASGAYEARRRIHETVNAQGQRLAAIETKADISKGLGSLGKAIMGRPCMHNQTTP